MILRSYRPEALELVMKSKVVAVVEPGKTVEESMQTPEGRREVYNWALRLADGVPS